MGSKYYRSIGFFIGIIFGAVLCVIVGTLMPYRDQAYCSSPINYYDPWCKLYAWQTIFSGIFALLAAVCTALILFSQISLERRKFNDDKVAIYSDEISRVQKLNALITAIAQLQGIFQNIKSAGIVGLDSQVEKVISCARESRSVLDLTPGIILANPGIIDEKKWLENCVNETEKLMSDIDTLCQNKNSRDVQRAQITLKNYFLRNPAIIETISENSKNLNNYMNQYINHLNLIRSNYY